jgi:hypothetical protein
MTFFPSRVLHDWRVDRRNPQPTARAKAMLLRSKGGRNR